MLHIDDEYEKHSNLGSIIKQKKVQILLRKIIWILSETNPKEIWLSKTFLILPERKKYINLLEDICSTVSFTDLDCC